MCSWRFFDFATCKLLVAFGTRRVAVKESPRVDGSDLQGFEEGLAICLEPGWEVRSVVSLFGCGSK